MFHFNQFKSLNIFKVISQFRTISYSRKCSIAKISIESNKEFKSYQEEELLVTDKRKSVGYINESKHNNDNQIKHQSKVTNQTDKCLKSKNILLNNIKNLINENSINDNTQKLIELEIHNYNLMLFNENNNSWKEFSNINTE